jgi:hypothetical protein
MWTTVADVAAAVVVAALFQLLMSLDLAFVGDNDDDTDYELSSS